MSISLTCSCGAKLEIDDKFAGQVVPCPDCQKPLDTRPPEEKPELPISGLAVLSLVLALTLAPTVFGTIAAVVVGILALRQIAREPDRLGGVNIARAGIITGGVFTFLTFVVLISGESLGVDSLIREFRSARDVDYKTEPGGVYKIVQPNANRDLGLKRPSTSWGKLKSDDDLLILTSLRDDAHLVCLQVKDAEDVATAQEQAADRFRKSDLFKSLTKPSDAKASPEPEAKKVEGSKTGDMTLDLRLGGFDRTFLLRVVKIGPDTYLLAAGARKGRFARLVEDFRQAFDNFKPLDN
jgi:hypothetical protein